MLQFANDFVHNEFQKFSLLSKNVSILIFCTLKIRLRNSSINRSNRWFMNIEYCILKEFAIKAPIINVEKLIWCQLHQNYMWMIIKKSDGINLTKHAIEIYGWYLHEFELCAIKWSLKANELSLWKERRKNRNIETRKRSICL